MSNSTIEAMLAKTFEPHWLVGPAFVQPKLDGMRLIWTGSELISRNGKPIVGVPHIAAELERNYKGTPLDGELYADRTAAGFDEVCGNIRRTKNIQPDTRIQYHVFDLPIEGESFTQRWMRAHKTVKQDGFLRLVDTRRLDDSMIELVKNNLEAIENDPSVRQQVEDSLNVFMSQGYEGTMIRMAESEYDFGGRTSDLLKVKKWFDEEFKIVGVVQLVRYQKVIVPPKTPGAKRYSDGTWYKNGDGTPDQMVGAIVCECEHPKTKVKQTFEVGTGMTNEHRTTYWNDQRHIIGKMLTVKFQEKTKDGIPRFPVHKTIRDYE